MTSSLVLPPLPSERKAEHYETDQPLLYLVDDEIMDSRVLSASAYENPGPRTISPGCLKLFTPGQAKTYYLTPCSVTEMNCPGVIPMDTWEAMRTNPEYLAKYLEDGSAENLSLRSIEVLRVAITERFEMENQYKSGQSVERPGRARHHTATMSPGFANWDEPTQFIEENGGLIAVTG